MQPTVPTHSLGLRLAYPLIWVLVGLLLLVLGPVRFRGRRRVPRRGGLLIVSNHLADVDPIVVQFACPRLVHFMAKSEIFEMPILGRMIRWFRAFPVKRGEPDRRSIKHAVGLLEQGEAVCIFPEGQLSEDGRLQPILPGAALIARMGTVPVICVGLKNTNRMLPYGKVIPRPALAWVTARWGETRLFAPKATAEEIVAWMESELRALSA